MPPTPRIASKDIPLIAQDKSRDLYTLPDNTLLVVYTDRLYAHDVEMQEPVPGKGVMLNRISTYWMNRFTHLAGNYLIVHDSELFPPVLAPYAPILAGRSVIAKKIKPLPFQFLTVGSLGGVDWQAYKETGMVRGRALPRGLKESERLDQAVMIPLPTGDTGREEGDGRKRALRLMGQKLFNATEEICLSVFGVARNYAAARGLTIADARFELGMADGYVYLLNEVMTPDAATYWPGEAIPGEPQPVFERKNMYSWLKVQRWNAKQPPPPLPEPLLIETAKRYRELCDIMTGNVPTLKKQEEAEARMEMQDGA